MKSIRLEQGREDRIHPSSINDLRQLWKLHGSKALIQELARMDGESANKSTESTHPADGLGEIFTSDEFNQSIRQ